MSIQGEANELYGVLGGTAFYRIEIPRQLWDRVVSFSKQGYNSIPDWIDLGFAKSVEDGEASRRIIATENPEWFTTTYEKMMGPNAGY